MSDQVMIDMVSTFQHRKVDLFLSIITNTHPHPWVYGTKTGWHETLSFTISLALPEQKHTGSFSQKYCHHIQSKKKKWSQIGGTYVYTGISPITLGYTWYNPLRGQGHRWRLLQGPRSKFGGVFWSPNFWILEWGMYVCMHGCMHACMDVCMSCMYVRNICSIISMLNIY